MPYAFQSSDSNISIGLHLIIGGENKIRTLQYQIESLEVQPDHIHLFVSAPPIYSPANLINVFTFNVDQDVLRRDCW